MSHKTSNRFQPQACGCGCGKVAPWNSLHIYRGPDRQSHFVLDECRGAFEMEAVASYRMRLLVAAIRGMAFWQRWGYARLFFLLALQMRTRLVGKKLALRTARRSTFLLCVPQRLGIWLARYVTWETKPTVLATIWAKVNNRKKVTHGTWL